MRCPKCGFISFDHLTSCSKCGRDVSQVAAELQGTSIKVEPPMFLSGALASFSEAGESFEHAVEAETGEGVDFDMETEEETISMAGEAAEEDIDFSFDEEAKGMEGAEVSPAEPEEAVPAPAEADIGADIEFSAEAEAEPAAEATEKESIEELDFMETAEEEEDGGLEFDLEDFMEEINEEEPDDSTT